VLVHPLGAERDALAIRREISRALGNVGLLADVVVLSVQEIESTGFWRDEDVVDLTAFTSQCTERGHSGS